jgi:hypothetical protein
MAKAQRLERLDLRRLELEAEYETALVAALQRCAAGSWGLFAHGDERSTRAKWEPAVTELGSAIDAMRANLAMAPFALHSEFEASRGPVSSNAPGEPKQARAWLDRLGMSVP